MFDVDKASSRCSNMWRKLGGLFEKAAYASVERGYHDTAIKCARLADVCFWQATGEHDSIMWKDVVSSPSDTGVK